MAVRIVTDSAAGLTPEIAQELGITVLELHVMDSVSKDGSVEKSTSGLTALELAAAYGRESQRSMNAAETEDGVVAIHLSRELSSTWSSAVAASGVFPDTVRVLDSTTAGMVQGAAAMAAAKLAQEGSSLAECYDAAADIISRGRTWVYIPSTEDLRKSGRISAATVVISTALLAIRPIMSIQNGKLEMVGKTRTQTKAFTKLVELVQEKAAGEPCFVAIQYHGEPDAAQELQRLLKGALCEESTFMVVPLTDVLAVHTGPGAIGVSVVFSQTQAEEPQAKHTLFKPKKSTGKPQV